MMTDIEYSEWLDNLSAEEREKFHIVTLRALVKSVVLLNILVDQYNLRQRNYKLRFKDKKSFLKEELYNAVCELTKITLFIDWGKLNNAIKEFRENQNNSYWDNPYEETMSVLFKEIICYPSNEAGLLNQYLNFDLTVLKSSSFNFNELEEFNKVVELMARFRFVILLTAFDLKRSYNKSLKAPHVFGNFESLFRDTDHAHKVKELFETRGYTVTGKWQGLTDTKTELLCAYYVLKDLGLLKPGSKTTPTAKIFYSEFGLPENYITDRMLRNPPKNQETINEFEKMFSPLLRSNK